MKAAITVNGHPIYTDKKLKNIVNGVAHFSDGSYCNPDTGEVVNNGKGYISLNSPSGDNKVIDVVLEPKVFNNIKSISASDFEGIKLTFTPWEKDYVEVSGKGSQRDIDNIIINQQTNNLVIRSKDRGHISGSNIVVSSNIFSSVFGRSQTVIQNCRGSNIIQVGGNTIINDGCFVPYPFIMEIKVPKGTDLIIDNNSGQINVGSTEGRINLSTGTGDFKIGKVTDVCIDVHGTANVDIKEVNGNLNVDVHGTGDVNIQNGQVLDLTVEVHGTGEFKFYGRANTADLCVHGTGDIFVKEVVQRPYISVHGVGDIKVSNWRR